MKAAFSALALLAASTFVPASHAAVIFSDNFDSETLGLNYTGFANWTVANGSVDLIGAGFFDLQPGNGRYVDLDGSTGDAGDMFSTTLSLSAGTHYTLSFDLAGSQRGDTNTVLYGIDLDNDNVLDFSDSATLASAVPFTLTSLGFTPGVSSGNARIVFSHTGGDNLGLLLDNVTLQSGAAVIPEPASLALLALGLVGMGAMRRNQLGKGAS